MPDSDAARSRSPLQEPDSDGVGVVITDAAEFLGLLADRGLPYAGETLSHTSNGGRAFHSTPRSRAGDTHFPTLFREVVERLGEWGQRHAAQQFALGNLNPTLLMWAMHRRIDVSHLPAPRVPISPAPVR